MMDESLERIQAHSLQILVCIDQRLDDATNSLNILLATSDPTNSWRYTAEYEKIMATVSRDLDYVKKNFTSHGLLSSCVENIKNKAVGIIQKILYAIDIDPSKPGAFQKRELKEMATETRLRLEDLDDVANHFRPYKGSVASGHDLFLNVVVLIEIGKALIKKRKKPT